MKDGIPAERTEKAQSSPQSLFTLSFFRPFSDARKLSLFAEELSSLLSAGLTVTDSLDLLAAQEGKREKAALLQAKRTISSGESFRAGMASCRCFPPLFLSLAEVGELSGSLPESLSRIAEYYRKEHEFFEKLRSALTYPVFILFFSCLVFLLMVTVVLPSFAPFFRMLDVPVPKVTELLIRFGQWLSVRGGALSFFVLFSGALLRIYILTGEGRRKWDALLFRSRFIRRILLIRFCIALSTLLAGGCTLGDSLEKTLPAVRNRTACRKLRTVQKQTREGSDFAEALRQSGFCMPVVYHLTRTGMESGELPHFLEEAAKILTHDTERAAERFRILIEPAMLLLVGGLILTILISVVLPILHAAGQVDGV